MLNGSEAGAIEERLMQSRWRGLLARWDLSTREVMMMMPAGAVGPSMPEDTEIRMRILLEIDRALSFDGGEVRLREWLREPQRYFGWQSPIEAMSGRLTDLRRLLIFLLRERVS